MRKFLVSAATVVAALTTLSVTPSAQATEIGYEGCTPGYWKNHTDNWQEMKSERLLGVVYRGAPPRVPGLTSPPAVLAWGGGGGEGAARILARASAAAYLNAAHEGLGYPWRRLTTGKDDRPALVATVNAAFASGDRDTMLALAARLDADNNLGCPLS